MEMEIVKKWPEGGRMARTILRISRLEGDEVTQLTPGKLVIWTREGVSNKQLLLDALREEEE